MSALFNSTSPPDRHKRKQLVLLEFWLFQVEDLLKGLNWLHNFGYSSGSINSKHLFYASGRRPWGVMHVPGLGELDSSRPRDLKWADFLYYA